MRIALDAGHAALCIPHRLRMRLCSAESSGDGRGSSGQVRLFDTKDMDAGGEIKSDEVNMQPLFLSSRSRGRELRVYAGSRVGTAVLALKYGHDPGGLGTTVAWTERKARNYAHG